jgi:uncharacterized protein YbjT (DUF2867 family)
VARVVKISGSPVSIKADSTASAGRDHYAIEEAVRATGRINVMIRPNPFMQNFLEQAPAVAGGALPGPTGELRVSFVDARDVGRVAAAALLSEGSLDPVLDITGPEPLTWFDVASTMSHVLGRPIIALPNAPRRPPEGAARNGPPRVAGGAHARTRSCAPRTKGSRGDTHA